MSNYKLVTINPIFYTEIIAKTGSEEILFKTWRSYVGLYNQEENWYIPLRSKINNKKPRSYYFLTPFETTNPNFKNPGLDFEKALYVPTNQVIEIKNVLPKQQAEYISKNIEII